MADRDAATNARSAEAKLHVAEQTSRWLNAYQKFQGAPAAAKWDDLSEQARDAKAEAADALLETPITKGQPFNVERAIAHTIDSLHRWRAKQ